MMPRRRQSRERALPVLPKAAFIAACNLFEGIARDAGLSVIEKTGNGGGAKRVVYDLTDAMVFESESGSYRLDELEAACLANQHEGRDLRVTSSFLGHGSNATKCIVGYSKRRHCVFVHDFETELTHLPADRATSALARFFKQ
jgi:hypothetical protein